MKIAKSAVWLMRGITVALVAVVVGANVELSTEIEGFTEPFRSIDVAAGETGVVVQLAIREGDAVQHGQVLGCLDSDLFAASLEIAKLQMQAQGPLNSALVTLQARADRLERLKALRENEHSSREEVDEAASEVAMAEAGVLAAREALDVKRLEYDRLKIQLDRRSIRSPIDGVVMQLIKEVGEFVAPTDPAVATILQLDPLLATFSVAPPYAGRLAVGEKIQLKIANGASTAEGTVEFISPVTDAQSGTVKVRIRLPNADGKYRCGEKCWLQVPSPLTSHLTRK